MKTTTDHTTGMRELIAAIDRAGRPSRPAAILLGIILFILLPACRCLAWADTLTVRVDVFNSDNIRMDSATVRVTVLRTGEVFHPGKRARNEPYMFTGVPRDTVRIDVSRPGYEPQTIRETPYRTEYGWHAVLVTLGTAEDCYEYRAQGRRFAYRYRPNRIAARVDHGCFAEVKKCAASVGLKRMYDKQGSFIIFEMSGQIRSDSSYQLEALRKCPCVIDAGPIRYEIPENSYTAFSSEFLIKVDLNQLLRSRHITRASARLRELVIEEFFTHPDIASYRRWDDYYIVKVRPSLGEGMMERMRMFAEDKCVLVMFNLPLTGSDKHD